MDDQMVDSDFEAALQSMQRDINCMTSEDRGTRRAAIVQVCNCLLAASKTTEEEAVRRLRVPKNPVALRAGCELNSTQRPFTLKQGDVIQVLEMVQLGERERVRFEKNGVECWCSVKAGDGGILLEEMEPLRTRGLIGGVDAKPGMLTFLLEKCQQPLARSLMDPVEKCRELASESIVKVVQAMSSAEDAGPIFEICMRVVVQRIGQKEVEEPAEEIRLKLLTLLLAFVELPSEVLSRDLLADHLGAVCNIAAKMSADPFPDIKKECATLVVQLAEVLPERTPHHSPQLARALLANTGHQHSRVRVATVLALHRLVLRGAETAYDELAPQFLVLTRDRASSVRAAMAEAVGSWAVAFVGQPELMPSLLRLLLQGCADEDTAAAGVARAGLEAAAQAHLSWAAQQEEDTRGYPSAESAQLAAETGEAVPGCVRPVHTDAEGAASAAARGPTTVLLHQYLRQVLPVVLDEISDWTSKARTFASFALNCLLNIAGETVTPYLGAVLTALYVALGDDEPAIVKKVVGCVEVLGSVVSVDDWMPLVLESITKYMGGAMAAPAAAPENGGGGGSADMLQHCVLTLCVLLRGCRQRAVAAGEDGREAEAARIAPHIPQIATLLASPALACHDMPEVQLCTLEACKELCEAVALVGAKACGIAVEENMVVSLLYALATRGQPLLHQDASAVLARVVVVMGLPDLATLYQRHFESVLQGLTANEEYREWKGSSPGRALFEVLLRGGGAAAQGYMTMVLGVFADTLQPARDPEMRMSFLVLLDTLVNNPGLHECLRDGKLPGPQGQIDGGPSYIEGVLKYMVLPNLIWKPGRVAAKLRKAACTVLLSISRCGIPRAADYLAVQAKLFPPLLSALDDDYEVGTRAITCKLFAHIFGTLAGGHMDDDLCRSIYPDLLKRLDDNSDPIRIDAAVTLGSFLPCIPEPTNGGKTMVEYCVQTLLIHLDDTAEEIRLPVLAALMTAAKVNPSITQEKTKEAVKRQRHAGQQLSKQLLEAIEAGV